MYETFYKLDATPFRLSPDQRFCFPHQSYANAKAYVSYALQQAEGFVMVTGAPGTGKTTLINDVIADLNAEQVVVGRLVSSELPAEDFLRTVAFAFGLDPAERDKATVLRDLEHFLIAQGRNGRNAVLIIDQAHELSPASLNEIATLANMQSGGPSSLQVILLGQEQLSEVLHAPSMEQLLQRFIAVRCLEPLQIDETKPYIEHRLREVGWKGDPSFEDDVFPLVHEFSRGVPRRLNLICSRLLLCGSLDETHTLDGEDVRVAVEWLHKEMLTPPNRATTAQPESSPPAVVESTRPVEPPSTNPRHEIERPTPGDKEFDSTSLDDSSLGPNRPEKTSKESPNDGSEPESGSGSMWTLTAELETLDDVAPQSADKDTDAAIDRIVATLPAYRDYANLNSRRKHPLINRFLVAALCLVLTVAAIYAISSGALHFAGLNSEPVTDLTEEQPQQSTSVADNPTPLVESEDEALDITAQETVDVQSNEGPQSLTERHNSEVEPLSGLDLAEITPAQTSDTDAPTERPPVAEVDTTQTLPLEPGFVSDPSIELSMEHSPKDDSGSEMSGQAGAPVLAGIPEQDISVLDVSERSMAILDVQERDAVVLDVSEPRVAVHDVNDFSVVTPSAPKIDMAVRNVAEVDAAVVNVTEHDTLMLNIRDYYATVVKVSELDIALLDFSEQSDEGTEFGVLEATEQTAETATPPPRGTETTSSESVNEERAGSLAMEERAPLQTELITTLPESSDEGAIEIRITAIDLEPPSQQHDEAELEAALEQEALIESLLAQAENDLQALRLTTPVGNNALERYQAVQEIQPDHPLARQGLQQIVARYAQLAQRSMTDGQFATAEEFLQRADSIDPNSDITRTLREQIANNGAAFVEETDRSLPVEKSGPLKVAIFPFESSETCSWPVDRGILDIATDLVRNNPSLVLTYSFYADSLQKQVIRETADVWEADVTRKGPIMDTVYDLGRKLGVDGVLMSWIECSPNSEKYEDWYPFEVYLFDPEQQQLYYNKDLLSNLRTGTRKVFFEFINQRTGQIQTP